ncbi:hypothetical protein EV356DRAFT_469495 [Viridothelium virens]|uniref:Nab2-like CCCH zinc finger domain-containing protein n=1 Tax=Viridothelium virens TaxID=1048519 RepID=A0A6A6H5L5_VIRVR|nr:hypothetical protein EV356DRAFT_469495 [Viridothelium virens]
MSVHVEPNTPLAESLISVVNPKLAEYGWSTGGADDNALSEYLLLMLASGKTQQDVASELQNDLLGLDPSDQGPAEFSRWLFQQVESLSGGSENGAAGVSSQPTDARQQSDADMTAEDSTKTAPEAEMADMLDAPSGAPTGPRSMRKGSQPGVRGRDKRMFGQLNKTMERPGGDALHRIKGAAGAGRINSHSREPPKGPRNFMRNQPMGPQGPMGGMLMQNMGAGGAAQALMNMNPQQQMQLFAMYEEQARMMAQILSPQQQQQMFPGQTPFNPAPNGMQSQGPKTSSKSLFERVQKGPRQNGQFNKRNQNGGKPQGDAMDTDALEVPTAGDPSSSMDVESSQEYKEPSESVCRFNLACTKVDCPFVHQSSAAPPGVTIDMTDECSYGAACKNHKCVGKHPSPAKKINFQAEQDCKFFPNCTNPACPFKHPDAKPCRNGADCSVPGCKFFHSTVKCKYNPCTNAYCLYKHEEGQKRGKFEDKVWVANGNKDEGGEENHVSERKFVQDENNEELIVPGSGNTQEETQIIT